MPPIAHRMAGGERGTMRASDASRLLSRRQSLHLRPITFHSMSRPPRSPLRLSATAVEAAAYTYILPLGPWSAIVYHLTVYFSRVARVRPR